MSELATLQKLMGHSIGEIIYESSLRRWDERASVRVKPRRRMPTDERRLLYFPPELVPAASHPLVVCRGPMATTSVLVGALYTYLDFTVELEQYSVNPVCAAISRNRAGFILPDLMRQDAFKIYTDEAWHAQFSDDLAMQVAGATGVVPPDRPPALRKRLLRLGESTSLPPQIMALVFAIVSETLISSFLADIPRDERIVTAIREVVKDHAIDEGVHHLYFASLLEHIWPQLTSEHKFDVSILLPKLIRAFVDPDLARVAAMLHDAGLSETEVGEVICDCYQRDGATKPATSAHATLRYFANVGIFDDSRARETCCETLNVSESTLAEFGR
jgi:hypothetical protein